MAQEGPEWMLGEVHRAVKGLSLSALKFRETEEVCGRLEWGKENGNRWEKALQRIPYAWTARGQTLWAKKNMIRDLQKKAQNKGLS